MTVLESLLSDVDEADDVLNDGFARRLLLRLVQSMREASVKDVPPRNIILMLHILELLSVQGSRVQPDGISELYKLLSKLFEVCAKVMRHDWTHRLTRGNTYLDRPSDAVSRKLCNSISDSRLYETILRVFLRCAEKIAWTFAIQCSRNVAHAELRQWYFKLCIWQH